jgi:uncharacterized protein (DUF58 family)
MLERLIPPPLSKDIRRHPIYRNFLLPRLLWRFLGHRLTPAGRWCLGITVLNLLFIAGSISFDLLTFPLLFHWGTLWGLSLLGLWLFPPRVGVGVRHAERIRAGETLAVELTISNPTRRPQADLTLFFWRLPFGIDAESEEGAPLGTVAAGATVRAVLRLLCPQRGVYPLPGFRMATSFPLGLMNAYRIHRHGESVIVHPVFLPLQRLELPTGRRYQPGGISLASKVADSFEYLGNREFRDGDNPRDIDWRATARLAGVPVVREWREEYFLRVGVLLDTYLPGQGISDEERRDRQDAFERAVSLAAAVTDALADRDYVVDLFAAGASVYRLTAGRGLAWREQILDLLACVDTSPNAPLEGIGPELIADLPRLTSVVCIVLDYDPVRQRFVDDLRRQGVGVRVLVATVGDASSVPPEPDLRAIDAAAFAAGVTAL